MKFLTTPSIQFNDLPDFTFDEHYITVDDFEGGQLNMHYLDEGDPNGDVVLLLHGEPSWCFLYRKMIPAIVNAGYRVIAPDLIGFGKSSKPTQLGDYTYQRHLDWIRNIIFKLDLENITLVCQDWGGLLGLRLVAEHENKFARVLAANTFLPTGDETPSDAFMKWKNFSQAVPEFPAAGIIKGATLSDLSDEIIRAYNAPYPDESYKAGARQFPNLVPITSDDPASEANRLAWQNLKAFNKPFITAFSDSDPVTVGGDIIMQKLIPGCQGQQHTTIQQAGHFLQEDQGEALADVLIQFIQNNPIIEAN